MTLVTYCTTEIINYISKMKEVTPMTATYTATLTTDAHGYLTGFTATRGREDKHRETFQTPVSPDNISQLIWEMTGLGWRILTRTGMTLYVAAPADARTVFPEDAFF